MTGMSLRFAPSNDLTPVLDALSDAILKVDSQWIVQYLNSAAARMLNVDRKDAIGRAIWEIAAEFPRDFVEKAGDTGTTGDILRIPARWGMETRRHNALGSGRQCNPDSVANSNRRFHR